MVPQENNNKSQHWAGYWGGPGVVLGGRVAQGDGVGRMGGHGNTVIRGHNEMS